MTGLDHYNHNDNNWWCAFDIPRHDAALGEALAQNFRLYYDEGGPTHERVRAMLARALRDSYLFQRVNPAELAKLSKVECAPQVLSERVVAWVRNSVGSHAEQAEALSDAILSTRWGCNRDGSHAGYSREAFQLLHSRFPDSPEAKRTPYWFN